MMRVRSLLFGLVVASSLAFGASAARAAPAAFDPAVPCATEPTEDRCIRCCERLGFTPYWDDDFGCACGT
jgi:hypothetical protein